MKRRLVYFLAAVFLFGSLGAADLTITFSSVRKGMIGAGTAGSEIHYYTSADMMTRGVESGMDTLVAFQPGIIYTIDHKKRTITKLSFDDALAAMESMNQPGNAGAAKMMATMFGDPDNCKVTKVGNETIAGRNCQQWQITVGKLVMDLSADPTLKLPMPETAYAQMMRTRAAQAAKAGPMGAIYKRLYEEMAKIKGIPLKTHMSGMMGMDVSTLASKVEIGPVPGATFTLPDGFKVEDLGPKLKAQMAKSQ